MMSQFDAWIKQEKDRIHQEYETKKQEVLGKSFEAGLANPDQKSQRNQLTADYERLGREEEVAIAEFMKTVNQ
jgi:hypothetical protein